MSAFARSLERRTARALLLLALVAPAASAETRSASQLTCLIDSGDVLATNDAGETASLVGGGFDFEQLASRRSARDRRLRLASSLQEQGFFPGSLGSSDRAGPAIRAGGTPPWNKPILLRNPCVSVSWLA